MKAVYLIPIQPPYSFLRSFVAKMSIILTLLNIALFNTSLFSQPIMRLSTTEIDYGTILQGSNMLRSFYFTNVGTQPLIIKSAQGSCACAVPSYKKEPIMPGESSTIDVLYDTQRIGPFTKTITIQTNEGDAPRVLVIKGNVVTVLNGFNLELLSNPLNAGTVTGGGKYSQAQTVSINAIPNANYTFLNWTDNSTVTPTIVSTSPRYSFMLNSNRSLTANFARIVCPTINITMGSTPKCPKDNTTITATATQGTAPYAYRWNNGSTTQILTNVPLGTYTVTATDSKGCNAVNSIRVVALNCQSVYDPVCGSDGKTYNNSCEAECAGVTWTKGTCNTVCNTIVNIVTSPKCPSNGSTITATASQGTAPYTYRWSNGSTAQTLTNVPFATYTVTATDSKGCSAVKSITTEAVYCTLQYDPVCGSDGRTYSNACFAACAGVTWNKGECSTTTPVGCKCTDFTATSFCDDFNAYTLGAIGPQSNCWTTWSGNEGGAEDGTVRELNGDKYMRIQGVDAAGGPQDVVLKLGDRKTGKYALKFKFYIYNADKGYFNILNSFASNSSSNAWLYHVYFDGYGAGRLQVGSTYYPFNYTAENWIEVLQEFDLDNKTVSLTVGGRLVRQWSANYANLSAINFYPVNNTYRYFIDDVSFSKINNTIRGTTSSTPIEAGLNVYPNPTSSSSILNIAYKATNDNEVNITLEDLTGRRISTHKEKTFKGENMYKLEIPNLSPGIYIIRLHQGKELFIRKLIIM